MTKITSIQFFKEWVNTVHSKKSELQKKWRNSKAYTASILGNENSVINKIAPKLNLKAYPKDYYSIDAIMYKDEDRVPNIPDNIYWFRRIRVAFEHENNFKSGLFQEVSHLLITQCDLRVLVSYPNHEIEDELNYLHEIIKGTPIASKISEEESFLIILGYENGFEWQGFIFKLDLWKEINLDL